MQNAITRFLLLFKLQGMLNSINLQKKTFLVWTLWWNHLNENSTWFESSWYSPSSELESRFTDVEFYPSPRRQLNWHPTWPFVAFIGRRTKTRNANGPIKIGRTWWIIFAQKLDNVELKTGRYHNGIVVVNCASCLVSLWLIVA